MRKIFLGATTFIAGVLVFLSCQPEIENRNARLEVWHTDGPGDFEEVNIDVQAVSIHSSETDDGNGRVMLNTEAGVYDVLKLTNGEETLLSSLELPAGRISQIRLQLGENNSVIVDGNEFDLAIPSASQSGLKLQVHEELEEGITYKITLDFDAARSVIQTGAGSYALKPVIRLLSEAESGAIKGVVDPTESTPAIYAISGEDTLGTTYANENGAFLLRGIPAGSYSVTFEPNENYSDRLVENVVVETGAVTDMQTVTLIEN